MNDNISTPPVEPPATNVIAHPVPINTPPNTAATRTAISLYAELLKTNMPPANVGLTKA